MARQMKDSGVEWIGEIPEDWKTSRIKYSFTSGKGLPITKDNLVEDGLAVVSYGQVHSKANTGTDIQECLLKYVDLHYQKHYPQCEVFQYDFIFADTSEDYEGCGNCAYKRDVSRLFGGYHVIVLHSIQREDNRYYAYLFKTDLWRKQLREVASGVKVFSITQNILMRCGLLVPQKYEQRRIADYLDTKCAEIDKVVEKTRETIEEYRKLKQSIITETVTKGLNPDAEMKDSGIPWIGKIPVEWKFTRIGSLYGLRVEKVSDLDFQPLSVTKLGIVPQLETTAKTNAHDDRKLVKVGDFVINSRSDRRGSCGISKYEGSVSLINTILYPIAEMNPQYYNWLFHTKEFADEFYRWGHGIVDDLWTTGWQDMKNIVIVQPSLSEQRRIADYLDAKCAELDTIIEKKEQLIEELGSYKKSLIYEYVTGKKEVQA